MNNQQTVADAAPLTITRITVPESLDAPGAEPFIAITLIANAVCRYDAGHDYFDQDPEELLPAWKDTTDRHYVGFSAERAGEIVAVGTLMVPHEDGATNVEYDLMVMPDRWGEGIEEALLAVIEDEARALGRPVVQTYTLHRPDAPGPRLASPTGLGSIPADDRQTRFMLEHGYSFEQTERNSVFDMTGPMDTVEALLERAQVAAGADYALVTWSSPTPEEYKDGFAYTISRMSTDVPTGDMVWAEETWDSARVERRDKRLADGGMSVSVACAVHVPTGAIAAYNELIIGADHTRATQQWGTLVLTEHRGHRLGMLVKCANLLRWRELFPDSPRVSTFNAEENRPMLDINETIGFIPASYAGGWKKTLSGASDSAGRSD